jgi:hypothetical protein
MTQHKPLQTNEIGSWLSQASTILLFKLGVILLGITAVIFVIAWFIFSDRPPFEPSLEHGLPVSAADGGGPLAQPGLVAITVNGIEWDAAQPLDPPRTVDVGGFVLNVLPPYLPEQQFWGAAELPPNQAGWLENSIINYVFRLPAGRAYQEMLATAAAEKAPVILTTAQGRQFEFVVDQGVAQQTAVSQRRIQQTSPAITVLWFDGDQSYMLTGDYVPRPQELERITLPERLLLIDENTDDVYLSVRLDSVDSQEEGLQLLIRGTITNSGLDIGTITENEINLAGEGLVSRMLSVNPPLPWRIPSGNSQIAFAVTFQRPPVDEAALTIGQHGFRLLFDQPAEFEDTAVP